MYEPNVTENSKIMKKKCNIGKYDYLPTYEYISESQFKSHNYEDITRTINASVGQHQQIYMVYHTKTSLNFATMTFFYKFRQRY